MANPNTGRWHCQDSFKISPNRHPKHDGDWTKVISDHPRVAPNRSCDIEALPDRPHARHTSHRRRTARRGAPYPSPKPQRHNATTPWPTSPMARKAGLTTGTAKVLHRHDDRARRTGLSHAAHHSCNHFHERRARVNRGLLDVRLHHFQPGYVPAFHDRQWHAAGPPATSPPPDLVLKLRDYEYATADMPFTSVWINLGALTIGQGRQRPSAAIDDPRSDTSLATGPATTHWTRSPASHQGPPTPAEQHHRPISLAVPTIPCGPVLPGSEV